jgi:hypothetical protein
MVNVSATDSEVGSLTVAMHEPVAFASVAAIAEVPPTLWLALGHDTTMVRYVAPDQTTDTSMAPPDPVNAYPRDLVPGGSRTPGSCVRSAACTLPEPTLVVVLVVVVGATVVVVTEEAGGTVVELAPGVERSGIVELARGVVVCADAATVVEVVGASAT